jgi:hypothetical protein
MRFAPLIAALGATSILALPAASAQRETPARFSLSVLQAHEVGVTVQFIAAFNGRRLERALDLLTPRVSVSDCDYRDVRAVSFNGRHEAARWLRGRFADRDRLTPTNIFSENPAQPVGVVAVEYARRTSNTLRALGFSAGIVPKLASKIVFTAQPVRIRAFANAPVGGDSNFCRPAGPRSRHRPH